MIDRRDGVHVWKYSYEQDPAAARVFDLRADPQEDQDLHDTVLAERLQDWQARVHEEFGVRVPVR